MALLERVFTPYALHHVCLLLVGAAGHEQQLCMSCDVLVDANEYGTAWIICASHMQPLATGQVGVHAMVMQ